MKLQKIEKLTLKNLLYTMKAFLTNEKKQELPIILNEKEINYIIEKINEDL